MQIKNHLFALATLSMAALSAGTANATTITLDSAWTGSTWSSLFSTWETNVTGATELPAFNSGVLPALSGGTATLTSSVGSFTVSGTSLSETTYSSLKAFQGESIDIATPGTGINAFYLALGSTDGSAITVILSDGESIALNPTPSSGGKVVLGLSISHPITSISISTTDASAVLWDFDYGSSTLTQDSPAVESATAILIGIGLVFFGAGRKIFATPAH